MSAPKRDVDVIDEPRRRYPADDVRMPEDVSHPHTTEDESTPSLRERVTGGKSKIVLGAAALAALAVAGYGVFLFGNVLFSFAMNPWVQAAVGGVAALGLGAVVGARRERSAISHTDSLVLLLRDGVRDFQGEYVETGDGPAFIPYRGRQGLLRPQQPYTMEQLSSELSRLDSKQGVSSDDDVVIELPRAFAAAAMTDRGVTAAVNTDGLKAAPFHPTAALRCEKPSLAHEGRLQDANDMIQELQDELATYRRRLNAVMNRLSYLIEDNDRRREDILDEMTELYTTLREADRPDYQRRSQSDEPTVDGLTASDIFGSDDS